MFNREGQVVSEEEVFYDAADIDDIDGVHHGAAVNDPAVVITDQKPGKTAVETKRSNNRKGKSEK
jgi:hypothetical protein